MQNFVFNTSRNITFGAGGMAKIGELAAGLAQAKVMIVTDAGMIATGFIEQATAYLRASGLEAIVFSNVVADPPESIVEEATARAIAEQVGLVIGLGGGSSLDVAKLVSLLAMGREKLSDVYGVNQATGPRRPLILVPTTSGTGSEVTPISIVTTGKNEKMGVVSPVLLPDIALLDPALTLGLPAPITAATGIDAMVHAIEAYASASPNNNPVSRALAEKALSLMGHALLTAVKDGSNIDARADMMLGSMLAGQAFANSPVAAVHALAYPLGGHFHIPHGLSNALVLPHVLRFNAQTCPAPYVQLAPFAFPELARVPQAERAGAFCDRLEALAKDCGLQQSLRELDIPEAALPMLAEDAMKQKRLLVNNPREMTYETALDIYRSAY